MFAFDCENGILSVKDSPFENGVITFRLADSRIDSAGLEWMPGKNGSVAALDGLELVVSVSEGALCVAVRNNGTKDAFLDEIRVAFPSGGSGNALLAGEYLEFIHAQNFGSNCGVKKVGLRTRWMENNPEGSMLYVLKKIDSDTAYMFHAIPPHEGDYTYFRALHSELHMEGAFGVMIRSEQKRSIPPGGMARMSGIGFVQGSSALTMIEECGRTFGNAVTRTRKSKVIGWNSWDYYAGAVTSKHIYDNQSAARRLFGDTIRHFVIDEGWEPRWGVWEANWKFPEGLAGYCARIKKENGAPGIWTAPLLVNAYTSLYRENPDWFGRAEDGSIAQQLYSYGPMAYLDITHPSVEEFIFNTFSRLRDEGFEYFKVDFTQEVLRCSRFHDMTTGRGGIIRKTFETIRRGIGEDAYLLSCGAPFESVYGTVDACRTCGDIHNFWAHVCSNAGMIASRWWMHGNLWNNDPDFLIVRTRETSPGNRFNREFTPKPFNYANSWLSGREMNLREAKTYALLVYLTAGDIVLSDNLAELNDAGVEILRKVLASPLSNAAVPVDMFDEHDSLPSTWISRQDDSAVVGVFNWDEMPRDMTVDLARHALDGFGSIQTFWDQRPVSPANGKVHLRLAARSAEGLVFE